MEFFGEVWGARGSLIMAAQGMSEFKTHDTPKQRMSLEDLFESVLREKADEILGGMLAEEEVLSHKEAAEFLRISPSTLYSISRTVPRRAVTERKVVYLKSDLIAWLKER